MTRTWAQIIYIVMKKLWKVDRRKLIGAKKRNRARCRIGFEAGILVNTYFVRGLVIVRCTVTF